MSQHVCAVLHEMAENLERPCHLFSLNDPVGVHVMKVAGRRFTVRGFGKKKGSFVRAVIAKIPNGRLVYTAHPSFGPLGLLCKLLNSRVHYVVTAHGTEVWNPMSWLHRLALQHATALTAVSASTAQYLIQVQGVDPSKIVVIPNAIGPDLLSPNGYKVGTDLLFGSRQILLAVGRLDAGERLKGLDKVILALPEVIKVVPELTFVIAGEGDDRQRLEDLAKGLGVSDSVCFTGALSDEELVGLYKRCDVFVMPSKQEGFGIVFLEAMACSKPVIGGRHGGTPEIILDSVTGYLVDHNDIETLIDRISRLLGDAALRRRMGEAGRRRVEENYTFEPMRKRFIGLLTEVFNA